MNYKKFSPQQHMERRQYTSSVEMDIYIQMILDEAHLLYRRNQLEDEINAALDNGNKKKFIVLTKEYKEIREKLA